MCCTYRYDRQPSGKYDEPWYHCVEKRKDGIFQWSWSFPTEESAKRFCQENQGKDLEYPGLRTK